MNVNGWNVDHSMDKVRVAAAVYDPDVQRLLIDQSQRVGPDVVVTSVKVEPDFRQDEPGNWTVIQLMAGEHPVNGAIVRQCTTCHAVYAPRTGHPNDSCPEGAVTDVIEE